MDFKNKTAFWIARLYNFSACVFLFSIKTNRKAAHNILKKIITGVKTSWRLCFLAFETSQALTAQFAHTELEDAMLTHLSYSC